MSKIDKLAVLGVRSFDNQRSETIQFYAPLTLIVGLNGSGKTTIVEALKYATSGELPPNSRGGAFIHDPKLCGEKEVLAQVRFSFLSTTGARMVATRNLQLTVKKSTRSQKTLEGSLLMVKEGERTVISSRVAELDQILPQYLGVSSAILDNVIFCHQDESLWPLSEPSVLKKKFDEIFEALKYTKAIDNIKQLRKKQNEELGKFKLTEQHAKENKDRADKAEKRSRELSDEIEALRIERESYHKDAKAIGVKAQEAWENAARFTEIVEKLKITRQKRDWHTGQRDKLLLNLEKRSESDEWLRSELEQSEARETAQQNLRDDKAKQYENVMNEIESTRQQQSNRRTEAGRLEQQKASHESKVRERELAIQSTAREQSIRGYDAELDEMQITDFMERIAKISKEQTARVDRAAREHAAETEKMQEVIDQLRDKRSTLLESRNAAKNLITDNERKSKMAHVDLESLSIDEGNRSTIESNISEIQSKLETAKQQLATDMASNRVRDSNKELQAVEFEISGLNRELIESTKHAGDLARLEHLQKELKDRRQTLKTLRATYGDRLKSLIGHEWNPTNVEKDFQSVMEDKRQEVAAAERQRDEDARNLEQVDFQLKFARNDLAKKRSQLQESAQAVKDKAQCDPEEYSTTLEEAEASRDTIKADLDNFKNMNKYFQEAIEFASKRNVCRLCRRGFDDQKAMAQFVETLKKAVSLKQQEQLQEQLQEMEEYLPMCREAGTSYDTWRRLSETEIPSLERAIKKNEEERGKALANLEKRDRVVKDKEDTKQEAETLSKPVTSIAKCNNELMNYDEQIKGLSAKHESTAQRRTLEDLHEKLEKLNGQAKDHRQKLAKLQQDEQSLRDKLSSLEIELGSEKARLMKADHELQKKTTINAQILELRDATQVQRDVIANVDQQLSELGSRMSEETMRMDDLRSRNKEQLASLQRTAKNLMDTVRDLERMDREVRQYVEQGGAAQLARCQREIESFDQQIEQLEGESKQIITKINEIREELDKKDRTKRIILDNLEYREACRELEVLENEISRLAAQNAEVDQQRHYDEAESYRKQHQELLAQETSKVERMKVKDDQLMQLLEDWQTDYKDAAANYKRAHIEVETTKAAVEDLGRYGGALDKAIMKYHSLKMEEINRIIEELWRRTYQGTDVDTIMIRSDNESAKGNRSYNYRVCMVKQDVEMDMRGRCSAGQKVLASIIIRLALAECFGVNCGIIALDEPTTNLDRDNICALAESLHHIIRQRRQQRNFQLIIITHDEDFLRAIKPGEFCDYYYRVSRNDRQKSIIERQSIGEVL